MTLRVDRSLLAPSEADYLNEALDTSAARRKRNRDAGRCINETTASTHGMATHGCRCLRCALVHRYGKSVARAMPEWKQFKPALPDQPTTEDNPVKNSAYTATYKSQSIAGEPGWLYELRFQGRLVATGWSRGRKRDAELDVRATINGRAAIDAVPAKAVA